MFKRILYVALLAALLVMGTPALAQGPVDPQHSDPTWTATYWNNMTLSGTPALTRQEFNIDFDWGVNAPDPGVNADQFSTRWTRYIDVTPGTYIFTATSDDGFRLWIDNALVLDKWTDHAVLTFTAEQYLGAGHHWIVVEYYENGGQAVAKLAWALKGQQSGGEWKAEYFNNVTLSGPPALTRNESALNYNWGAGSPAAGVVNSDYFSARWTRSVSIPTGMTRFTMAVDDGARLWVNGHLLIDAWRDQAAATYTGDIYLPGGAVTVEMQYYENTGMAVAQLSWAPPGSGTPNAVVVDNLDAGFVKGGATAGWRSANEGYNGNLYWTYNNDRTRTNYNWARWYPKLVAGRYEVYIYVPDRYSTTAQARYWVVASGQYTLRIVNQSANGGKWVSLGTYTFKGDGNEYVSLSDVTYETYLSRLIAFDAAKWEPR